MSAEKESSSREGAIKKHSWDSINQYFGNQVPVFCSLQDAAKITGLSYEYLLESSKSKNKNKIPGIRPLKSKYHVYVAEIPDWLERISQC